MSKKKQIPDDDLVRTTATIPSTLHSKVSGLKGTKSLAVVINQGLGLWTLLKSNGMADVVNLFPLQYDVPTEDAIFWIKKGFEKLASEVGEMQKNAENAAKEGAISSRKQKSKKAR